MNPVPLTPETSIMVLDRAAVRQWCVQSLESPAMRKGGLADKVIRIAVRSAFPWPFSCSDKPCGRMIASNDPVSASVCASKMTLAGLEPAIYGSDDQRLIH